MVYIVKFYCYISLARGRQGSKTNLIYLMKHKILYLSMTMVMLLGALTFTACGGDDSDDPGYSLSVTPTDISLMSSEGATASFSITASSNWVIQCDADWVNLSSRGGNGNSSINVTALSENKTASERVTTITVTCGDQSKQITVKQLPAYKNVAVNVTDIVTLTSSAAFKLTFSEDVSYFYFGTLSAEAAGWPDDRIASKLATGSAEKPSDNDTYGIGGLNSNSSYYLCAVAYNAQGERGPVTKTLITTKPYTTNRARVTYGSVTYSSSYWYWATTIGPYASKYYMVAYSGIDAYIFNNYPDALVAAIIQNAVNKGTNTPIIQNGEWNRSRNSGSYFYSAAWAKDANNEWSPELDEKYYSTSSSSAPAESDEDSKAPTIQSVNMAEILKNITLYHN